MSNQGQLLYRLQTKELQILKHQRRLAEIAEALANNDAVKTAQAQVEQTTLALKPLQTKAKDLDLQMKSANEKREATEKRLYSGTVKNPKEMTDMQNELASLQQRGKDLDEKLLEAMFAVEEAQEQLAQNQANLQAVIQAWENSNQALLAEKAQLEKHIADLLIERKEALQPITPDALKVYQTLKPQKGNQPIALLQEQTCGVCGIEQNAMIVKAVKRGDELTPCNNCRRILVSMG